MKLRPPRAFAAARTSGRPGPPQLPKLQLLNEPVPQNVSTLGVVAFVELLLRYSCWLALARDNGQLTKDQSASSISNQQCRSCLLSTDFCLLLLIIQQCLFPVSASPRLRVPVSPRPMSPSASGRRTSRSASATVDSSAEPANARGRNGPLLFLSGPTCCIIGQP